MPDWDENSRELQDNLGWVYKLIEKGADRRDPPSLDDVRTWHFEMMRELTLDNHPDPDARGNFRGAKGYPEMNYNVCVGENRGAPDNEVTTQTKQFEDAFSKRITLLDGKIAAGAHPQTDAEIEEVIATAAWAHAEWVRIHPFGNGNGRTARMWANWVLIRYGIPPFVNLRPRPGGDYGDAGAAAMEGGWRPTFNVFVNMYDDWIAEH